MITSEQKLSNDFQILLSIYEYNVLKHEDVGFNDLLRIHRDVDREEIGKNIDKLMDLCMIETYWAKQDKKWKLCYKIEDDEALYFAMKQYENTEPVAGSNQQQKEPKEKDREL